MVKLTFSQLIKFGVHLGHSYRESSFFSAWMLYGWRNNVFIINLVYSLYFFRASVNLIRKFVYMRKPIWFINLRKDDSISMSKYVYLCGEVFCAYKWINGFLTNFRFVIGRGNYLHKIIYKQKFLLRHFERKRISSHLGFIFNRRTLPGTAIFLSLKEAINAIIEFRTSLIPIIGIVDSNVVPSDISIPICGNDDSFLCLVFYISFFCRLILVNKMKFLIKWEKQVRKKETKKRPKPVNLYLLYKLCNSNINITNRALFHKTFIIEKKEVQKKNDILFKNFSKTDIIHWWNDTKK